jgi:hypothetical protein
MSAGAVHAAPDLAPERITDLPGDILPATSVWRVFLKLAHQ